MKNSIILENLSSEQLLSLFKDLHKELQEIKHYFQPKEPTELLTRQETAKLLKCDQSTLHNWTIKGKLSKHCIGNRVYYKRSEIEAALVAICKKQ